MLGIRLLVQSFFITISLNSCKTSLYMYVNKGQGEKPMAHSILSFP